MAQLPKLQEISDHLREKLRLPTIAVNKYNIQWDPHEVYLSANLEALQNCDAHFIYSDYSKYSSLTVIKESCQSTAIEPSLKTFTPIHYFTNFTTYHFVRIFFSCRHLSFYAAITLTK